MSNATVSSVIAERTAAPLAHVEVTARWVDLEAATSAMSDLLVALGLDPSSEELRERCAGHRSALSASAW
jgi:hypothetical protein